MAMRDSLSRHVDGLIRWARQNFENSDALRSPAVVLGLTRSLPAVIHTESAAFYASLEAALKDCASRHIETCRVWLMNNIVPSQSRLEAFGKFLVTLCRSLSINPALNGGRDCRNILDLISDLLHHINYHGTANVSPSEITKSLQPFLEDLVKSVASTMKEKGSLAEKKLKALLNHWVQMGLVSFENFMRLRGIAAAALAQTQGDVPPEEQRIHTLPVEFGYPGRPWNVQPVSLMIEPLLKHPYRSVAPNEIRPIRFEQTEPSERVKRLVDQFLEDIDLQYRPTGDNPTGGTPKYRLFLDAMGQLIKEHRKTGEKTIVSNGYGWSSKLCQDLWKNDIPDQVKQLRSQSQLNASQAQSNMPQARANVAWVDADTAQGQTNVSQGQAGAAPNQGMATPRGPRGRSRSPNRSGFDRTETDYRSRSQGRNERLSGQDRDRDYRRGQYDDRRNWNREYSGNRNSEYSGYSIEAGPNSGTTTGAGMQTGGYSGQSSYPIQLPTFPYQDSGVTPSPYSATYPQGPSNAGTSPYNNYQGGAYGQQQGAFPGSQGGGQLQNPTNTGFQQGGFNNYSSNYRGNYNSNRGGNYGGNRGGNRGMGYRSRGGRGNSGNQGRRNYR